MAKANPYRSPNTESELSQIGGQDSIANRVTTRYRWPIWLVVYFYPVWLLASFYLVWAIAWIELGRFPRPLLDDPKSIGGFTSFVYFGPGVFLILMPLWAPAGLIASWFHPISRSSSSGGVWAIVFAAIYVTLFSIAWLTLRSDPWQVVYWWFD